MDSNNIDRLGRSLTGTTSRRQALRLMGGGLVGSFALASGVKGASAQTANVGQLLSGLINVNVSDIEVNIGDITVEDLIDVNDVLNNNEIRILNNVLNNNEIASRNQDILTNLLRDARILNSAQVVVGVLSGQLVVLGL